MKIQIRQPAVRTIMLHRKTNPNWQIVVFCCCPSTLLKYGFSVHRSNTTPAVSCSKHRCLYAAAATGAFSDTLCSKAPLFSISSMRSASSYLPTVNTYQTVQQHDKHMQRFLINSNISSDASMGGETTRRSFLIPSRQFPTQLTSSTTDGTASVSEQQSFLISECAIMWSIDLSVFRFQNPDITLNGYNSAEPLKSRQKTRGKKRMTRHKTTKKKCSLHGSTEESGGMSTKNRHRSAREATTGV